jgi:hypothetical protein
MRLSVRLERSTDTHSGELFDGEFRPARKPTPRGFLELATPPLDLPSGIPLIVRGLYDPDHDTGELVIESAGVKLAQVAPLRAPLYLTVRLASDEVICISALRRV